MNPANLQNKYSCILCFEQWTDGFYCIFFAESVQSDLENGLSPNRRDVGFEDGKTSVITEAHTGPDAVSEALSTLSSEVRRGQDVNDRDSKGKNVNVKDILRSLVSAPSDEIIVDPSLILPGFLGAVGDASRNQSVQFHSFDR